MLASVLVCECKSFLLKLMGVLWFCGDSVPGGVPLYVDSILKCYQKIQSAESEKHAQGGTKIHHSAG